MILKAFLAGLYSGDFTNGEKMHLRKKKLINEVNTLW